MNINTSLNKKVRGQKRKVQSMIDEIENRTMVFPEVDLENGYWHMHLPVKQAFINSNKTPIKIKRVCIQTMIDYAERLVRIKPINDETIRVLAFINLPDLWYSEIIVFFGETHYKGYFYRNNEYQKWELLPDNRSIEKEMHIKIPELFKIKGYREILNNNGEMYENELWYIGEID